MSLFKKAAIFTDIHFGQKSNSTIHNNDCLDFIHWFIEKALDANCETCIFLGDYFDNRNNINLLTLNYGLQGMRLLNDAFKKVYIIPGNHDNYYKDNRLVNSISWANYLSNIEIINEWSNRDGVIFAPWLVQDEYKKISESSGDYIFGHFELPNFLMNAKFVMPDLGLIHDSQFSRISSVYSGHFHKRQHRSNITYIGNAFPLNFGDADDDDRGMMILPYNEKPQFINWEESPKYRVVHISDLVINPAQYLLNKSYINLILDNDVSYEEAIYLKETLAAEYNIRKMSLVYMKKTLDNNNLTNNANITFQSVDNIVQSQLSSIESTFYNPNMLLKIYQDL
jgi:DNA repair exonuclease SbcCD nuclease subunit